VTDSALRARRKALAALLYLDLFGAGRLETADAIQAPDAISHGPGVPVAIGTEGIKSQALLLRTAFPDLQVQLLRQLGEGDLVASHWYGSGTHRGPLNLPTGVVAPSETPVEFTEIRIDRFDGERIVESWFLPDRFTLWQQLGLIGPSR
jgi:predicted ester cyclase